MKFQDVVYFVPVQPLHALKRGEHGETRRLHRLTDSDDVLGQYMLKLRFNVGKLSYNGLIISSMSILG